MDDIMKKKKAAEVYAALCAALDSVNWKYSKGEDNQGNPEVEFSVSGDDLAMEFTMKLDIKRQLVRLHSQLPFKFKGDKRLIGAIATSQANYKLADGSFDIDLGGGAVYFRMTASYRDSVLSKEAFLYLVRASYNIVDEYNDKFYDLATGRMLLAEYFEAIGA